MGVQEENTLVLFQMLLMTNFYFCEEYHPPKYQNPLFRQQQAMLLFQNTSQTSGENTPLKFYRENWFFKRK